MSEYLKHATDLNEFISEMHAGTFKDKVSATLSQAAQGVILNAGAHCKKAKVVIEFNISQIGDMDQVVVSHKYSSVIPTKRGKKMEEDTTETPFFVGKGGQMTINPPKEEESGQKPFQLKKENDGNSKITSIN